MYQKKTNFISFEPHRYSRVSSLKIQFAKSFSNSNLVLLCPIYTRRKKDLKFNQINFMKLISKYSHTQVIIIKIKWISKIFKK